MNNNQNVIKNDSYQVIKVISLKKGTFGLIMNLVAIGILVLGFVVLYFAVNLNIIDDFIQTFSGNLDDRYPMIIVFLLTVLFMILGMMLNLFVEMLLMKKFGSGKARFFFSWSVIGVGYENPVAKKNFLFAQSASVLIPVLLLLPLALLIQEPYYYYALVILIANAIAVIPAIIALWSYQADTPISFSNGEISILKRVNEEV